jgi:hypothetical protein
MKHDRSLLAVLGRHMFPSLVALRWFGLQGQAIRRDASINAGLKLCAGNRTTHEK